MIWFFEVAVEPLSLGPIEAAALKAFLSSRGGYRPPYGKRSGKPS